MVHNLWELKKKIRRKLNEKFEFRFRVFYDNIPKNFKPIYEFTCPCPSSCAAKIKTRKYVAHNDSILYIQNNICTIFQEKARVPNQS